MPGTSSKYDERKLALLVAQGDERAFGRLFHRYLPVIRSFVRKFTGSCEGAEEVIQEAFIRIWLNRERLEAVVNVRAWIFRFVSNECLNYLRRDLQEKKVLREIGLTYCNQADTTGDTVRLNEIRRLLDEAIGHLPPQRQRIYRMSRMKGMKIEEIAHALGISPNTVKNTLVSSLKTIRQYLALSGHVLSILVSTSVLP